MMESKCRICEHLREEKSEFCSRHKPAYENLITAYCIWKNALGIDWKTFLIEIAGNQETGEWAREVARQILATLSTESPA